MPLENSALPKDVLLWSIESVEFGQQSAHIKLYTYIVDSHSLYTATRIMLQIQLYFFTFC